eukprot:2078080-Rhodomonas_salina.1
MWRGTEREGKAGEGGEGGSAESQERGRGLKGGGNGAQVALQLATLLSDDYAQPPSSPGRSQVHPLLR